MSMTMKQAAQAIRAIYGSTCQACGAGIQQGSRLCNPSCAHNIPTLVPTPEVKVGQVWRDHGNKENCTITHVAPDWIGFKFSIFGGSMGKSLWETEVARGRFTLLVDVASVPTAPKVCDCGARVAKTSHSSWCSAYAP